MLTTTPRFWSLKQDDVPLGTYSTHSDFDPDPHSPSRHGSPTFRDTSARFGDGILSPASSKAEVAKRGPGYNSPASPFDEAPLHTFGGSAASSPKRGDVPRILGGGFSKTARLLSAPDNEVLSKPSPTAYTLPSSFDRAASPPRAHRSNRSPSPGRAGSPGGRSSSRGSGAGSPAADMSLWATGSLASPVAVPPQEGSWAFANSGRARTLTPNGKIFRTTDEPGGSMLGPGSHVSLSDWATQSPGRSVRLMMSTSSFDAVPRRAIESRSRTNRRMRQFAAYSTGGATGSGGRPATTSARRGTFFGTYGAAAAAQVQAQARSTAASAKQKFQAETLARGHESDIWAVRDLPEVPVTKRKPRRAKPPRAVRPATSA